MSDTYQIKIGGGVKPEVFASLTRLSGNILGIGASFAKSLALPLTGIFTGAALVSFVSNAGAAADALGDLREETGLAIETLGGLKLAADIKGLGDIDLPMKKFSAAVREAQVEGTKFNQLFKTMGVDPMRELDEVLFDVADKFQSWEDGINKLGIAEDLFGTKQTRFIQLLNMGSAGLKDNVSQFRATHGVVSQTSDVVDEYNKQLALLKSAAEGLAQSLTTILGPALTGILEKMNQMANRFKADALLQDTLVGIFGQMAGGKVSSTSGGAAPNPSTPKDTGKIPEEVRLQREIVDLQIEENKLETERGLLTTISEERKQFLLEQGHRREMLLIDEKRAMLTEVTGIEAERLELQDKRDLLRIEQEHMAHLDRKMARERAHQAELARIRSIQVQGVSQMFGNMAIVAEAFGKKGLAAYRVFATAQAIIDTARAAIGAYAATVGIPYIGPILAPIAAGAAVAVGTAQIAKINGAFYEGGYTGNMGTGDVAGVVHGREYVIPANRTSEFGIGFFEGIRNGDIKPADVGGAGGKGGANVSVAFVDNRQALREFMATEGNKMAYDFTSRRMSRV